MHTCPRKPDLNGRYTSTAQFLLAPSGAFLLFLVTVCGLPAQAAQMEGPTLYEVDPTLAVISDDGSEAFYAEGSTLTQLNLSQNTSAKLNLDSGVTGKEFQLAGFAPAGELVGYSQTKLWTYDPARQTLRTVFTSPKQKKIRYATIQKATSSVMVSLAPKDYPADSSEETLSFSIHDLVKLTWRGEKIAEERIHTRREVLPPGAVFDNDGSLFFPMRDVYQCEMEGDSLDGGRCLPVSTECVFTGGGSPGTFGARSIAVSGKMIYVFINRLGGSGPGFLVRFQKLRLPESADLFDNPDGRYRQVMTLYANSLRSMEILQTNVSDTALCASANGNHVLIGCQLFGNKPGERQWFKVTNDGRPIPLPLK